MELIDLSFLAKLKTAYNLLHLSFKDEEFKKLNIKAQNILELLSIKLYAFACAIEAQDDIVMEKPDD